MRRILSMDPGTRNFAWAFSVEGELQEVGWLTTATDVHQDAEFLNAYLELIARLQPTEVIAERYMYRGVSTVDSEYVNLMLGKLQLLTRMRLGVELWLITAAQWKVYYQLKQLGVDARHYFPTIKSIHQADAACIGKYAFEYWLV